MLAEGNSDYTLNVADQLLLFQKSVMDNVNYFYS